MTKPTCPKCKSKNLAKFLYGLVRIDNESDKTIDDKKIIRGGCSREWDSPNWRCNECGHRWNDDKKMKKFMSGLGKICLECDSQNIAQIFWGYPANFDEKMEERVERKEIVMGGCIVTDHDPNWECNECYNRWGERED